MKAVISFRKYGRRIGLAMKCHQVLTGACNPGDRTFGVGSVEGNRVDI